jgi:hypothetical protein
MPVPNEAAPHHIPTAAPVAEAKGKQTITITFETEDAPLVAKIQADAKADARTPNKLLLLFLRRNYKGA